MDFLSCKAKVSWARIAARSFKRQDSSASLVPIEQHHRPRKRRKTRLVPQPFTSLHRNFEQGALAELVFFVATGVKCQVSCDMALIEVEGAPSSFQNTRIPSDWVQHARDCRK
jgi:hypothetical protein